MSNSGPIGRVVIIGAGQAGIEAAGALRMNGYTQEVVVVGEEQGLPYSRPPLSKGFLTGELDESMLALRTQDQLVDQGIKLLSGHQVTEINRGSGQVLLDDGSSLAYDQLVIASGGTPRQLGTPELAAAGNVFSLRTLGDAEKLKGYLKPGTKAVIIGGGYIGLEIASAAKSAGVGVTVLEAAPRVLARVTSPVMSDFFQRLHAEEGVEIVLNAQVERFLTTETGDISAVQLAGGRTVEADFVLVGIGLIPRTELAEAAGLEVDNGIVVDEGLRTSDPRVYAIGDVARHPDPQHGGFRRLESAPNASEQARCVAASILGDFRAYSALPWFWSIQYDVKLQVAGLAQGYDNIVVRGDAESGRRVTVLYLREDILIAADVVNLPAEFAACKRLISAQAPLDPARLNDLNIPLKDCIAAKVPV